MKDLVLVIFLVYFKLSLNNIILYYNFILFEMKGNVFKMIIFIMFFIIIINLLIHISKTDSKENFTPGIREIYNPYIRNIRLFGENYYKKIKSNSNLFFRKFGLI